MNNSYAIIILLTVVYFIKQESVVLCIKFFVEFSLILAFVGNRGVFERIYNRLCVRALSLIYMK